MAVWKGAYLGFLAFFSQRVMNVSRAGMARQMVGSLLAENACWIRFASCLMNVSDCRCTFV